jgi:hypothetical protein
MKILIYLLLLTSYSYSQSNITEIKYKVNTDNGKAAGIDTIYYTYESNNLVSKQFNQNEPVTSITYSYSSVNKLERERHYKNSSLVSLYKYEYDKSGKLIKEKCYDGNNKLLFSNSLKYDSKGNLVSKKSNISTGFKMVNSYDYRNLNVKVVISGNSRNQKEIEYLYDDKGYLIQETVFQSLKKSKSGKRYQVSKIKYKYNDQNLLVQKQNYLTDGIWEIFNYSYDDNLKLIKWEKQNPQGKVEFYVEYRYE